MATRAKSTRPKSEPDDQGGKPNGKTKDQEREQVRPREEEPRSARGSTAKQAGRRSKGSKPSRKAREQQEVQQRAQEILEARRLERPQQQPEDLSEGKWEAEEREAEDRARQEQQFRKQ
ncbi:MAG TPA: hypothetical protein VEI97_08785, partial [bacterium]|nr:hypothetical protein [bacterium]